MHVETRKGTNKMQAWPMTVRPLGQITPQHDVASGTYWRYSAVRTTRGKDLGEQPLRATVENSYTSARWRTLALRYNIW